VVHRWLGRASRSLCSAWRKKGDPEEPADHALGRSRGGFTTKIHLLCDRHGHPLHVHLTAGQAHESQALETLLEGVHVAGEETDEVLHPVRLAGDKGYRADWIDEYLLGQGITPVIPSKENEDRDARPVEFDRDAYRERNIIERLIGWLKESRRIQLYGGRWRRWLGRGFNIGLGEAADAMPDVAAIERDLDYVAGASMYAPRAYVEGVGAFDERYFLYYEETDWCFRRGDWRLGYAHESVVIHAHGSTIGSSVSRATRSALSVYLDERNKLLFTRRFDGAILPVVALFTLALTAQYVRAGAWKNFRIALAGWWAGLRGEAGFPKRFG